MKTGPILILVISVTLIIALTYYFLKRPETANSAATTAVKAAAEAEKAALDAANAVKSSGVNSADTPYSGWFWWGSNGKDIKVVYANGTHNVVPQGLWSPVTQASAKSPTHDKILMTDGSIKIPLSGLYTLSFNIWMTNAPNVWWTIRKSAAYNVTNNDYLPTENLGNSTGTGWATFTGFFQANDLVSPTFWVPGDASFIANSHRMSMSVVCIYACKV